jgi:nucleoside 2-deoxyribosyltransferase
MAFAKEMLDSKNLLEKKGHTVKVPHDTDVHLDDERLVDDLDRNLVHAKERDLMMESFKLVASSDAILVLNYKRKGIEGYIGTSTLMEIGLAHYLGKKIFLLNDVPSHDEVRWAHEIRLIDPVILHGDVERIS